ncbi:hypothetical protein BDN70DRAFT_874817 [Pholiota conissans]|uniref:F-box domain-containing protein n=1 Tax=Pholiota conissans TaxID=109636 RepID=A0A9P6D4H0_9AGAR|nr:hypothetical protein BDN70DRAFT_874817 [Pholiota conissans]
MALIYKIHPEILSIVFENTKDMTDEIPSPRRGDAGIKHPVAFEVTACAVCTYFREVAFATPSLWTTIWMRGTSDPENIAQRLSRTGDFWLDIRIDLGVKDPAMDAAKVKSIVDNILQRSLRWRSLCLVYGCEERDDPLVMRLCSAPAPGLRRLSLTVEDIDTGDGSIINRSVSLPHIFKDGTPQLEFIRLRGFSVHLFRPPLSSVVTLHMDQTRTIGLHYSTLAGILTASPHLANLSLYGDIIGQGNWPDEQKTIDLPALRSLRLYSISGEGYPAILKIINAPRLQSLTLKGLQGGDLEDIWNIQDKARFDALKSLSLVDCDMNFWTCHRMFETFRQITTFSAVHASPEKGEAKVLENLSRGEVGGQNGAQFMPWPKLTTIRLGPEFYAKGQEATSSFVAARREYGCPIFIVVFRVGTEQMDGALSSRTAMGAGVEVKFCNRITWPEGSIHQDRDDTFFDLSI